MSGEFEKDATRTASEDVGKNLSAAVGKRYPGTFTAAGLHELANLRGVPNALNPELHLSTIRRAWNRF